MRAALLGSLLGLALGLQSAAAQQISSPSPQIVIQGNAALKATSTKLAPTVIRSHFATPGDTAAITYNRSASVCPLNAGNGDDGAQVRSADGKCWLMVPPPGGAPFTAWGGAPGQNVDAPLKAALAWACTTHVPILAPYPGTTPYLLNSAVSIGNGSATQLSTCDGVTLKGVPAYPEATSGVGLYQAFKFNGAAGIVPFNAQGPAAAIKILDIAVDCNGVCATGFRFHNIIHGEFAGLGVFSNKGPAFVVTSEPVNTWQGAMEASWFHDLLANYPAPGGSGMLIGAASVGDCSTGIAVINDTFERMVFVYDGNTAGAYGIKLQYATQLSFSRVTALRTTPSALLGHALVVQDPAGTGCPSYPTDIKFSHTVMDSASDTGTWAPVSGGIHLDHWATTWGGFPIATRPGNFWGTDSKGIAFPSGAWVPGDTSGAGLTLTVTDARYRANQGICTVEFNLTYPVTANTAVAEIGTLPMPACTPLFTASSVVGAPFLFTDLGSPVSLVCNAAGRCAFYNNQSGSAYTNAGLSGKNFRFAATYITQSQPP